MDGGGSNKEMKKICLIVPDLNKGGMERVMSELAYYFTSRQNTFVEMILLTRQSDDFYKIPESVLIHKPGFKFNNQIRFISTIRTLFFLRNNIRRMMPDTVLSFGETYNSFVLLSCLFLNVNIFVSDRSRPDKRWGFLQEFLRRRLYPRAAGIVSQTNYSKDFLRSETNHKNISVIPNPVKIINSDWSVKENIILNVGRLINSKRIDLLLYIFSKINNKYWDLWIVGEDENKEMVELQGLAKELNIADRVKFWGKRNDIEEFYRVARIFAFTSESEGLPNVLLEAMAAGLACISFDCIAGPRDLITDGYDGYLVKMYDCEEYIEKLDSLISNCDIRNNMSSNARDKAKRFDLEIIGDKFYNFILA